MTNPMVGASIDSTRDLLENPFWNALGTEHTKFAISAPLARRYPADIVPFGGVFDGRTEALADLRGLLDLGEEIYATGDELSDCPGMESLGQLPAWQMVYREADSATHLDLHERSIVKPPIVQSPVIEQMTAADADAMVALTDVAFPGYFRLRTCAMGSYYGIRIDGVLIALAGERVALPGIREISAVCTHPAHTGQGYARKLIKRILKEHASAGLRSFLHVGNSNERAIALYEQLGFVKRRKIIFHRLRRISF
jgi:ribosomal protein S18 acetylase RimI-like enzyme